MNKADWQKLTVRELTEEEKDFFGEQVSTIWEGVTPELDEEVLVYTEKSGVTTAPWVAYGVG